MFPPLFWTYPLILHMSKVSFREVKRLNWLYSINYVALTLKSTFLFCSAVLQLS